MKKERKELPLHVLELNKGQLDWLPTNPRTWTQSDIDRTAASIKEDPDFLEDRPLLVVPGSDDRFIVFAGNLRHEGAAAAKRGTVPCVVYYPQGDAERATVVRRAMKDNGSFGSWDWDELGNSWDDMPLQDWGVPVWESDAQKAMRNGGLSTEGREGGEGYDEFLDKFEQKLTTDDCYTPPAVYDAVKEFVNEKVRPLKGVPVVRPFYPGGNYEDLKQYPKGCIVIDNPPFSILSKIVRFYCEHSIPFFIFAPELTLFAAADCDVTYINCDAHIIYENGADVRTGFITNMIQDLRVWCSVELRDKLDAAQPDDDKSKQGFIYPDNIITSAILAKIVKRGVELKVRKCSCEYIKQSDSAEEQGRALYGGGFIMSDHAAAERAAAERAAATRLNLSDREKAIIARLNKQDEENYAKIAEINN